MFSGIVEESAQIDTVVEGDERRKLGVVSKCDHSGTQLGDSICVDGVCLTVVSKEQLGDSGAEWLLSFDIASETARCTTFGSVRAGDAVHLERSLAVGDRIHGHIVTGHVDGVAEVSSRAEEGETTKLTLHLPHSSPLVAPKGSVCLAGVSLTVGEVEGASFSVYLIPHTKEVTRLGALQVGDGINFEFDMLARYVQQNIEHMRQ